MRVWFAVALAACGTTGGNFVSFDVVAQGAPGAGVADTGLGWHVELSKATLHIGAVYLNQSVPSAGGPEEPCVLPGIYVGEVFGGLERVTRAVGRTINPTVYTVAEFSKRAKTQNAFVTRVLEQPKLWVIGSEDNLPVPAGGAPSSRIPAV